MAIRLAINGACGKMGQAVLRLTKDDNELEVTCLLEADSHPCIGMEYSTCTDIKGVDVKVTSKLDSMVDVLIDFSRAQATLQRLKECVNLKIPIVIGTTGFKEEDYKKIKDASKKIAVLLAPNMSYSINLLYRILEDLAKELPDHDTEIIESHSKTKKDAPSGTSLRIAQLIAGARGLDPHKCVVYGRSGPDSARKKDQISIHSLRIADVVAEHEVIFSNRGESIYVVHKARSRDIYASGAIKAAKFIYRAKPALYSMLDIIKPACVPVCRANGTGRQRTGRR